MPAPSPRGRRPGSKQQRWNLPTQLLVDDRPLCAWYQNGTLHFRRKGTRKVLRLSLRGAYAAAEETQEVRRGQHLFSFAPPRVTGDAAQGLTTPVPNLP